MSEVHFYDRIKEIANLSVAAKKDGTITFAEGASIVGEIVQAGMHVWAALNDDERHFSQLVEACEKLFDEYIQPLDLPVPNVIEGPVDRFLRSQIRPALATIQEAMGA